MLLSRMVEVEEVVLVILIFLVIFLICLKISLEKVLEEEVDVQENQIIEGPTLGMI